jgi:putative photosynthetic complex assembly protein 2
MSDVVLPVAVSISGWWFFTGVILWLVHRPVHWHRAIAMLWTLLLLPALLAVHLSAADTSPTGTVQAFALSLFIWGWLELTYLTGLLAGPAVHACPPGSTVTQRFFRGLATCLHHELAAIALLAMLSILSWGLPNHTAFWTFSVLLLMRWSAKLNLVLGVRNYNQQWLPAHLHYLDSYIPRRRMNVLFPFSLLMGVGVSLAVLEAFQMSVSLGERISLLLVGTLTVLGTLEHVFFNVTDG